MVYVKTGSKDLKFKVQGKLVDNETPVAVALDHNVQVKLDEKTLVQVKRPAAKKIETPTEKKGKDK